MNLEALDSLYAKSTPPDWRTRAEVDFFTALWDSYPALRDRLRALEEALEDMTWQFAYRSQDKQTLSTGGLSALELAFDTLGWDDPTTEEKLRAALDKEANDG